MLCSVFSMCMWTASNICMLVPTGTLMTGGYALNTPLSPFFFLHKWDSWAWKCSNVTYETTGTERRYILKQNLSTGLMDTKQKFIELSMIFRQLSEVASHFRATNLQRIESFKWNYWSMDPYLEFKYQYMH